jgi:hypothetical protein
MKVRLTANAANHGGQVAQSVEQRTENPCVECSIHSLPTNTFCPFERVPQPKLQPTASKPARVSVLKSAGCVERPLGNRGHSRQDEGVPLAQAADSRRIDFLEWTLDARLRHASFAELRLGKTRLSPP